MELVHKYPSQQKIQIHRTLSFSASGVCLLILLAIIDAGLESKSISISMQGAAFAITVWLFIGSILEYFIFIGPKSYQYYQSDKFKRFFGLCFTIGGISLLTTIGGLLIHMENYLIWFFVAGTVMGWIMISLFVVGLSNAIFDSETKEAKAQQETV